MAAPTLNSQATNSQATGTSMNVAVGAGTNAGILVYVVSRSTSESFTTPTLTGVTFAAVSPDPIPARGQHRDKLYWAYGSWSAANVVCGFSQSTVHAAQAVIFDGVDATAPFTYIKYRNTLGDSGASTGGTDTVAMDITFDNTDVDQLMTVFCSSRNRPTNSNPADAAYTRIGSVASGTGGSDQTITSEYRTLSPTGSDTWNANTTGTAVDWCTAALLVNQPAGGGGGPTLRLLASTGVGT